MIEEAAEAIAEPAALAASKGEGRGLERPKWIRNYLKKEIQEMYKFKYV